MRWVQGAPVGTDAIVLRVADLVTWLRPIQELALEQEHDPDVLQAGRVLSTVVACLMRTPVDRGTLAALAQTAMLIAQAKGRAGGSS
jgi:hypothetical protein